MGRRSVTIIEIDNIIEEAINSFNAAMRKSGNNLYLNLIETIEGLPVDIDKNILPLNATGAVQDAIVDAFDTGVFNQRIDRLKPPLTDINNALKRDYSRRLGVIEDSAIEQGKQIQNNFSLRIDQEFEDLDVDNTLVSPIMTTFKNGVGGTIADLKAALRARIPDVVVNFTTFRADNLYDQFSRQISETYADSFGLVWAKYEESSRPETSRDFCLLRKGKYFHKNEIQGWGNLNWEGRIPTTNANNIFELLGGYNCVDKLTWVKDNKVPKATISAWSNGRDVNKVTI